MAASAVAPWLLGLTGPGYGATAVALTGAFLLLAARVAMSRETEPAQMAAERQMFAFSVLYLFILFCALLADRMLLSLRPRTSRFTATFSGAPPWRSASCLARLRYCSSLSPSPPYV